MALCALVIPVLGYIGRGWLDGVIYLIYAILILCCHYRAEELRRLNATGTHFIHSFITRFPIRTLRALQQTFYGSPPACPVLGFSPPCV